MTELLVALSLCDPSRSWNRFPTLLHSLFAPTAAKCPTNRKTTSSTPGFQTVTQRNGWSLPPLFCMALIILESTPSSSQRALSVCMISYRELDEPAGAAKSHSSLFSTTAPLPPCQTRASMAAEWRWRRCSANGFAGEPASPKSWMVMNCLVPRSPIHSHAISARERLARSSQGPSTLPRRWLQLKRTPPVTTSPLDLHQPPPPLPC
jgi:hypothetical protein